MTEAAAPRQRGSVRRRRDRWQVRVSAGKDPITGERIILTDSVVIERPGNSRSERTAFKEAEKRLTKLLAGADEQRVARTRTTVGALVERWMSLHEIDSTTRMTYEAQVRLYIVPNLGDVPLTHFARDASERLEASTEGCAGAGRCAPADRSSSATSPRSRTTASPWSPRCSG